MIDALDSLAGPVRRCIPPESARAALTAASAALPPVAATAAAAPATSTPTRAPSDVIVLSPAARILAAMPAGEAESLRNDWLGRGDGRFGQARMDLPAQRHAADAGMAMVYGWPRSDLVLRRDARELAARFPAAEAEDAAKVSDADADAAVGDGAGGAAKESASASAAVGDADGTRSLGGRALNWAELRMVESLKARDEEVRVHEQAHIAAGGPYVRGAAAYAYRQGPDGKRYAVGGEVSIDVSPERDPARTIEKMKTVRAAAMAPADPSPQDRRVAAQAAQAEMEARQAMRIENPGGDRRRSNGNGGLFPSSAPEGEQEEAALSGGARS